MELHGVWNQLHDKISVMQKNIKEVKNRQHEPKLNILQVPATNESGVALSFFFKFRLSVLRNRSMEDINFLSKSLGLYCCRRILDFIKYM
jgi:hypothetical protein